MKKIFIGFTLSLISNFSLGDMVNDILETKVKKNIEQEKIINKYDIFQCGFKKNESRDFKRWDSCNNSKKTYIPTEYSERSNDLYKILKRDYELGNNIQCITYSSTNGLTPIQVTQLLKSDQSEKHTDVSYKDFKLFNRNAPRYYKLGSELHPMLMSAGFSLWEDLDFSIRDIGLLKHPNMNEDYRQNITFRFQQRYRFIEKSCGREFTNAFSEYLNDYSKFAEEMYTSEQSRLNKINEEKQRQQREKIEAKEKYQAKMNENMRISNQLYEENRIKKEKQDRCYKQNNYKIYDLSNQLVNLYSWLNGAEENLKKDDARNKISGVSNLKLRYEAANDILNYEKRINNVFKQYKLVGGTATKPSLVKRITNPCVY